MDSVSPSWGTVGAQVTVYGSTFSTDSAQVLFGSVSSTAVTPGTETSLSAVVPGSAPVGLVNVTVRNSDGTSGTLANAFEVVVPPTLDSVSPAQGTIGTEVRLYGADFASDSVRVFYGFGDTEAGRVLFEAGSIFAIAPEGLAADGTYDIRVVNRDKAADTLLAGYTVVAPEAIRINGVTKPSGLRGMTIIMDGDAFGDSLAISGGKIFFTDANGAPVEAVVADTANDWTNTFAVTTVPVETANTSWVWVETVTGVSDSIQFLITQAGTFSPSVIAWTETTPLPQPLQGLGAAFVPIEEGPAPANWVMTVGGADDQNVATDAVYRATVAQSGALGASWDAMTPLPEARAYHTTAAATAFTAALDTTTTGAYLYAVGGVDAAGNAVNSVFYAQVDLEGNVGAWSSTTSLPMALHSAGAVLYAVGGETGTSAPVSTVQTNTESAATHFARINIRTAGLSDTGWSTTAAMAKIRSKHSAVFGGGSILVTSGIYSGQPGSSENTYAGLLSDGSLDSWQGATGSDIIANDLGYSIYNQAAVSFIDQNGTGHVLILGGARRDAEGTPSAGVVYY